MKGRHNLCGSFPKARWGLMSKVAKCLFMDGLDPRNWSRFTKITAQRAFSIANYYHHDFGVRLGRVYNLAAETRCPESVYVGDLYQGARWMETELWTFKPISLDPPEFRRRLDTVSRPLRRAEHDQGAFGSVCRTGCSSSPEK